MDSAFEILAREFGKATVTPPWIKAGPPVGRLEGYKLHVSATPANYELTLKVTSTIVARFGASMKAVSTIESLIKLNSGGFGDTQVGKCITVYPPDDRVCNELAAELVVSTTGLRGPRITTDVFLGGTVYARRGVLDGEREMDRLGLPTRRFRRGAVEIDDPYLANPTMETWKDNPFTIPIPIRTDEVDLSDIRFGAGIATKPSGSVFLGHMPSAGDKLIIVKQALTDVATDEVGIDAVGRLENEFRIRAHLASRDAADPAIGFRRGHGASYLLLNHHDGAALADCPLGADASPSWLAYFVRRLWSELRRVHAADVLHRDLSPRNILIGRNAKDVWLIDFGISTASSEQIAGRGGTPGFSPPSQLSANDDYQPSISEDVHAFASTVLFAYAGRDPRGILFGLRKRGDLARRLSTFAWIPAGVRNLLDDWLAPDRDCVLSVSEVDYAVERIGNGAVRVAIDTPAAIAENADNADVAVYRNAVAGSIRYLLGELPRSSRGLWLSAAIDEPDSDARSICISANRGNAGVLYLLARCFGIGIEADLCRNAIERLIDWLLAEVDWPDGSLPGLHFGRAGVLDAAVEAIRWGAIKDDGWLAPFAYNTLSTAPDWPDLTHGAAGQLVAALRMRACLPDDVWLRRARVFGEFLCQAQDSEGAFPLGKGCEAMEGRRYFGFAHGAAGIGFALIVAGDELECERYSAAGIRALDWVLSHSTRSPHGRNWTESESDRTVRHWWCHGSPGIALALAHAWALTGESRFRQCAAEAVEPLLSSSWWLPNLSLCHGVSGAAEVLLDVGRLIDDNRVEDGGRQLARRLLEFGRSGDGFRWLPEGSAPTADLMVGVGGVIHTLLRIADTERRFAFPLTPTNREAD